MAPDTSCEVCVTMLFTNPVTFGVEDDTSTSTTFANDLSVNTTDAVIILDNLSTGV